MQASPGKRRRETGLGAQYRLLLVIGREMASWKQEGSTGTHGKMDVASWRLRILGWGSPSWMTGMVNRAELGSGLVPIAKLFESTRCLMRFEGCDVEAGDISGLFQEERPIEEEAQE